MAKKYMQESGISARQQSKYSRFSKANVQYQSIEEYFSDLGSVYTIIKTGIKNENAFLDYLDIIQVTLKDQKIDFDWNSYNDFDSFVFDLDRVVNGNNNFWADLGENEFDGKTITYKDVYLQKIQSKICTIAVEPIINLEKYISKDFFGVLMAFVYKQYVRVSDTELFDWSLQWWEETVEESYHECENDDQDKNNYYEELKTITYFKDCLEHSKFLYPTYSDLKLDKRKLNKEEKIIYETLLRIDSFNHDNINDFIDDDDYIFESEFFDGYIETDENLSIDKEYGKSLIIERCYMALYAVSFNIDDGFMERYVANINDSSNNGYWPFELIRYDYKYDINGPIPDSLWENRNRVVQYYNDYCNINYLIEDYLKNVQS